MDIFEQNTQKAQQTMLENILNGMEALICVCDSENFEILFLNDSIKSHFGIEGDARGKLCHKVLQGLDEPCATCPHAQLLEEPVRPYKTLLWEHHEIKTNRVLRKTARLIDWPGGRLGHLEYAIDITGVREAEERMQLMLREIEHMNSLLHAVNSISVILLQSNSYTIKDDLLQSLSIIADAAGIDRSYIWENHVADGEVFYNQVLEWRNGNGQMIGRNVFEGINYREVLPSWDEAFRQKLCVNGAVREMPEVERNILTRMGMLSILVVPIFLKDSLWGFIGFCDCHSERKFSKDEEKILRVASEIIANTLIRENMAINILQLEAEAGKIYYDSMTGIYNRRFLEEKLKQIITAMSRSNRMLSVMMIDIDTFKTFNDTYGHIEGDRCIQYVADVLKNTITRSDDFVARYGGDEFVVVLPDTHERGARTIANKFLENIMKTEKPFTEDSAACHVAISIGVAVGTVTHTQTPDEYISLADKMLYVSKCEGRNRYSLAVLRDSVI